MKRNRKADTVRVMGTRWQWDYAGRFWQSREGWRLRYEGDNWLLVSPSGVRITIRSADRYGAMVRAGFIIADAERRG